MIVAKVNGQKKMDSKRPSTDRIVGREKGILLSDNMISRYCMEDTTVDDFFSHSGALNVKVRVCVSPGNDRGLLIIAVAPTVKTICHRIPMTSSLLEQIDVIHTDIPHSWVWPQRLVSY